MIRTKSIISAILLLLLLTPAPICLRAQTTTSADATTVQAADDGSTSSTDTKKKDKVKDVIEISDNFFYSIAIDLASVALIILLIYYPNYRKMEYIFTYFMFNIIIFLLTFVLNEVKISMGAAFGLFAVFSMLRYRTEGISMKDMTYLFIFIGMGLIGAINLEFHELGIIYGIIIVTTFLLDGMFVFRKVHSKLVRYENIELIKPESRQALIEDLRNRTGLDIKRISIDKVDFLRDTALINIYYFENK